MTAVESTTTAATSDTLTQKLTEVFMEMSPDKGKRDFSQLILQFVQESPVSDPAWVAWVVQLAKKLCGKQSKIESVSSLVYSTCRNY
jgi:hypothetical protein